MAGNYDVKLDILRIFSCILVVMLHICAYVLGQYETGSGIVTVLLLRCLCSVAVPTFMAISGYLLFYYKERTAKEIYLSNLPKYLVSYLIWFGLYLIFCYKSISGTDFSLDGLFEYIVHNCYDSGYLWFVKLYITVLIAFPLIKCITDNKPAKKLYCVFWLLCVVLRYTVIPFGVIREPILFWIQIPFVQISGFFAGTTVCNYPTELLGIFVLGGVIFMV